MNHPLLIVAGAGKGLGRELSLEGLRAGYAVVAVSRSPAALKSLEDEAGDLAPLLKSLSVDLCDAQATSVAISEIARATPVRALINCAATWTGGREAWDLTTAEFQASIDANFFTALNAIQPVLAGWRAQVVKSPLAIVNVGATASLRGGKKSAAFAVAKGALRTLSQSLAKELAPNGVHVAHLIIDGLIDNPRTRILNQAVAADRFINPKSLAQSILRVVEEPRDCWTFEWDVRPFNEPW